MTFPARVLRADRERCIGSGACAFTAPDVFDQDDTDGRVVILNSAPTEKLQNSVLDAVRGCPVSALELLEFDATESK